MNYAQLIVEVGQLTLDAKLTPEQHQNLLALIQKAYQTGYADATNMSVFNRMAEESMEQYRTFWLKMMGIK